MPFLICQVIVHAAAERRPDVTDKDPDATEALNVSATKTIAQLAAEVGAFVIYISTDYVFDGKSPPYHVDGQPNPLNSYGQSKLEGEKLTRSVLPDDSCVLRIPVLYGDVETLDESAVTVLFKAVQDTKTPAKMNNHERRYPTHVADVATVCRQIADRVLTTERKSLAGILHWSGSECMTKYDMARRMAELAGLPTEHLVPVGAIPGGVPRPYDCHLDCSVLERMGIGQRTPFDEGVKAALRKFDRPRTSAEEGPPRQD